jgi:hypothetical protein
VLSTAVIARLVAAWQTSRPSMATRKTSNRRVDLRAGAGRDAGNQGVRVQGRRADDGIMLLGSAQDRWRAVSGPHLSRWCAGARLDKAMLVERPDADEAAGVAA